MQLQRLTASQLSLNIPLEWDVLDEEGHLLLRRGQKLARETQLQVLLARGIYRKFNGEAITNAVNNTKANPFQTWNTILQELEALLRNIHLEDNFAEQTANLAKLLQQHVVRNPDASLAAMNLSDQQRYAAAHSLNVAIIVELAAKLMGWDDKRRTSVCCAAMTMNVAMSDLQDTLRKQRMAPNQQQREQIRAHPELAEKLLRQAGVKDEVWLRAVMEHHESPDGSGYPYGIKNPSEESQLVRVADIFNAKTSARGARKGLAAHEAARSLYVSELNTQTGTHQYVAALIKEVGIFPPGSIVKLANNEVGVVFKRGKNANTPIVYSYLNSSGITYGDPIRRDTTRKGLEIVEMLQKEKLNVALEELWLKT